MQQELGQANYYFKSAEVYSNHDVGGGLPAFAYYKSLASGLVQLSLALDALNTKIDRIDQHLQRQNPATMNVATISAMKLR